METLHGFPFFRIEFTKEGAVFKPQQRQEILQQLPAGTTDVMVLSHGWNNDIADAQSLYNGLLQSLRAETPQSFASRKFAVVGVFWPSKRFTDAELIPGGGASFGGTQNELERQLDDLDALLQRDALPEQETAVAATAPIEEAKALVPAIESEDMSAAEQLIEIVRRRVAAGTREPDGDEAKEDASNRFFEDRPDLILSNLEIPFESEADDAGGFGGGAAGGIGGGSTFKSVFDRAKDVMNFTTYYVMKTRAGDVGKKGVAPLVDDIAAKLPNARMHLVGHSFGGRVVAAAAANTKKPLASLSLLQAAFSHNGFGDDTKGLVGFFRTVVTGKRVQGPIIITHTRNDKAVGLAYPIASRMAGDRTSALGDAKDVFGGMGSNGAQHAQAIAGTLTPDIKLASLQFKPGKIYNLLSDTVVSGHSDITNRNVARAIVAAMTA